MREEHKDERGSGESIQNVNGDVCDQFPNLSAYSREIIK